MCYLCLLQAIGTYYAVVRLLIGSSESSCGPLRGPLCPPETICFDMYCVMQVVSRRTRASRDFEFKIQESRRGWTVAYLAGSRGDNQPISEINGKAVSQ